MPYLVSISERLGCRVLRAGTIRYNQQVIRFKYSFVELDKKEEEREEKRATR
jgi:hypothetical protein